MSKRKSRVVPVSLNKVMKILRCGRCNRRYRGNGEWNLVFRQSVLIGCLCPRCQTPEENAEAEIKMATLDYYADESGFLAARPENKP